MKENMKVRGQLKWYLAWPLLLSLFLMFANVAVLLVSWQAACMMLPFTITYIAMSAWLRVYSRKRVLGGLVEFSAEYAWIQKQLLTEMALPYALADDDGRIVWMNQAFQDIIAREKGARKNLISLFPEVTKTDLAVDNETAQVHTSFGEYKFRLDLQPIFVSGTEEEDIEALVSRQKLLAVYLFDETENLRYRQEITDERMVAGLIYLDNYDEALESVEEVRRSLLTALIDRKINKAIGSIEGVVKKLEKDKYFFTIKQKYMEQLEEERFSILEEVKAVNIGNEMAVTLSIGIGMGGDSYSQNYDFARAAIDMALGRGGDQAVVKNGSRIQYYGGKSQQLEKATRVKARVKAHALRELVETKDRLLIMGHQMSDIDSFGAAIGIYRIAVALNKKAHIVINQVTSSVQPMMDRFLDNPEYPEDLFLKGPQAAELVDNNTMLVVVDVNRPSITDAPELLKMVKTIVVLDHHRQSSEVITNAVLSYVEPYASSTCEMVAEVLQYIADGIRIKPAEADTMYAGIVIDTNNFTNQTGVRTFEAAAYLRRSGADVTRVRKLFRDDMADYKAKAYTITSAEVYRDSFSIGVCPAEGLHSPTIVGAQAANELLEIKGIKASVVLTEYQNTIYVSARSIDEVNVQVMMEQLGGGGHRTIAGAQLKDGTIEDAKRRVKEVIDQMLQKGDIS
ncbi:MAG: DHH family phosphoesterase [Monoglobales bacterium]|jgi:c-di-AMP phosphodiesterase-like protein|uniref:DHH family phosphoesterase n=1 Tax=Candidatus Ventrimonas sp. TaxID=3048889 RepID=UPI0015AA06F6